MKINYFGEIAEITNKASEDLNLSEATLSQLLSYLLSSYNLHAEDLHIAINHDIVSVHENFDLKESDEVAVLSPFAGG